MREPVLPNFFIVGTGKAGTTSLYHYLAQHPQIYMSPVKEPCYFASEIHAGNLTETHLRHIRRMSRQFRDRFPDGQRVRPMSWLIKEWDDYVRLFQTVEGQIAVGEASVAYLWSESAATNIASVIPEAKIVMILRDPANRAFSQYVHQLSMGLTRSSFRQHIEKCMKNTDRKISALYPLLEVGLYSHQVQRYLDRFPRHRVRIYWYEEAWKRPREFLQNLFEFLGVEKTFSPDFSRRSLEGRAPRFAAVNYAAKRFEVMHRVRELVPFGVRPIVRKLLFRRSGALKMDAEDRRYLVDYYREDIVRLASMLNRDLSDWLSV